MNTIPHLKRICLLLFFPVVINVFSASAQNRAETLHELNTLLVNTVMIDFFTLPVASRIYSYPNIAFYECIRQDDPSLPSLAGKLNGLKVIPEAPKNSEVDHFIAACVCFSFVAQNLVGSEYKFDDWRKSFVDSLMLKDNNDIIKNSLVYGRTVADSILLWSKKDNYGPSRGMPRFSISSQAGTWQPTPADYAPAIEPHWNTIRPYTLSSPSQFSPKENLFTAGKRILCFTRP